MYHLNPKTLPQEYPSGTPYYLVKCQIPAPTAEDPFRKVPYQKKHPTEAAAEKDRNRLIREYNGGGSVSGGQLKDFEFGQKRLETCQGDARGKSATFAIEWFISHFVDNSKTPFTEDAVALFLKEHLPHLRTKTREEYNHYLPLLAARFGKHRIGDLTTEVLQEYIDANPAKLHHRKCLIGFFSFCAGGSRKIQSEHHWLTRNPAQHVKLVKNKKDSEIVIYTIDEVKNALAMALMVGDLPYWVWCMYTGMRPEEAKKFWTIEGYGWDRVNLDGGFIIVNSEMAKDKRRRKILIQPNLRAWLKYFQAAEEPMFPVSHRLKFREVKKAAIAHEKYAVKDVIRHTYISYRVHSFDKSIGVTASECGNTSNNNSSHSKDT